MEKYEVEITEYLQRIIEVEAESPEDAVYKVEEDYDNCNIVLDSGDFTGKDIEIYNPNKFISKFDLLMDKIDKFNRKHNESNSPADIIKSISNQANELLAYYKSNDNADLKETEDKLVDLMNYCFRMAMILKLNPIDIINNKMDKNEE